MVMTMGLSGNDDGVEEDGYVMETYCFKRSYGDDLS